MQLGSIIKPPWRDFVFVMWGPRKQTFTRESCAKAPRKKSAKVKPRKQRRKQVDCRNAFKYLCRCESKNCARESTAKAGAKRLEPLRYPVFDTAHNRQSHKFISTVNSLDNCQTKIVKKWAVMSLKIAFAQSIVGIMVQTGVSNFIAKSFLMTSSTALSTSWPAPTTRSTRTAGVGVVDIHGPLFFLTLRLFF